METKQIVALIVVILLVGFIIFRLIKPPPKSDAKNNISDKK